MLRASLCLLVLWSGCAGVASSARRGPDRAETAMAPVRIHYLPGEHMEWEVRWFDVLCGRIQLAVGSPGMFEGHRAVVVRAVARSDGALALVRQGSIELVTVVDLDRGLPVAQSGSFDDIYSGTVLGTSLPVTDWPMTPWSADIGGGEIAHSSHTLLGILRGWRPPLGTATHFHVRVNSLVVRTDVVAAGHERVSSPLGRRRALRIEGLATPVDQERRPRPDRRTYRFAVWIDDEGAERVPLRIEIESGFGGVVRMNLVTYDGSIAEVLRRADR